MRQLSQQETGSSMDLADTAFVYEIIFIFFSPARAVGVTAPP